MNLGCVDCHGGNVGINAGSATPGSTEYAAAQRDAHVPPRHPKVWRDQKNHDRLSSANPERSYTLLNDESPEFIRFINPGDLRVARATCGSCHVNEVGQVERSLMTTSAMLWGGAAYNNGIVPAKHYITRRVLHAPTVVPQKLNTVPPPTAEEQAKGVLPFLVPLPPLERRAAAGSVARLRARRSHRPLGRVRGRQPETRAVPRSPGKPDMKFGTRGLGTDLRISARRPQHPQDAPERPALVVPRHQRPPGRLPLERLHRRVTSSTPTTADPRASGTLRQVRPRRPLPRQAIRPSRRTSPAIRSSTG